MRQRGFLTASEAAKSAGMSRERIVRLLQLGRLRGERLADRWLVEADSLEELIQQQQAAR